MRNILPLLLLLALVSSCQVFIKHNEPPRIASNEGYQAQIKSDKKKQAELDLPFRGFNADKSIQTIAFGSAATNCWEAIEKNKPELMILTSAPVKNLSKVPEYRSIREKVPFMCSPNSETKTEYLKDWPYAKNIIPENQDGVYHSKVFGFKKNQIQIILIDQINTDKKWTWLENELTKPTSLKILTIPVEEREKLFTLIKKIKLKNLIILPNNRPIVSIEKTEINNQITVYEALAQSRKVSTDIEPINFGLIKVDWSSRKAILEIRTIDDKKVTMVSLIF